MTCILHFIIFHNSHFGITLFHLNLRYVLYRSFIALRWASYNSPQLYLSQEINTSTTLHGSIRTLLNVINCIKNEVVPRKRFLWILRKENDEMRQMYLLGNYYYQITIAFFSLWRKQIFNFKHKTKVLKTQWQ